MHMMGGTPPRAIAINWRRALIAAPLLAFVLAATWWFAVRDDASASTPRAMLVDPPPSAAASDVGVRKGQLARDFIVTSPEGETFRLSDLRGKPVVINFWATWCTSCLTEMPQLADVQREFGPGNLHVVAINTGESSSEARRFIEGLGADAFLYGMDPTLTLSDAYGVFGLSTSVFVDADGVIRATYVGQMDQELMREYVRAAGAGIDGAEPPPKLRLPGTVEARSSVVTVSDDGHGRATFESRRLRCDDTYCARGAIDVLSRSGGVLNLAYDPAHEPPRLEVEFEPQVASLEQVAQTLAAALEASGDPLYEHPVELRYE